ncbi:hypothetical protein [Aurantiacibacter aquimixticola]|uniref:Uncharacterized protein n=1 Tax=Aurantiacibacter aquimixticola TaxID=1958945 RepID=A0A419RU34_9SPHN|nr:hypothetical protein [Aurantiacibacter aquimixticola]RJY09303.1 hypothetical protein D6201_07980 [Aurantiacibacter aquimixticola]
MTVTTQSKAKPGLWIGLFFANAAVITVLHITDAINAPTFWIVFALNFVLLIPIVKSGKQLQEQKGAMTQAMRDYNRRFLICSAIYSVLMLGSAGIANRIADGSALMWGLALLPMLPAFGMIWTMMRYLREETDEYQRYKAVRASMVGLGFVLVLGTGWGFLETFGLVPHIWAWWVFPAWAIGLAFGMIGAGKGEA